MNDGQQLDEAIDRLSGLLHKILVEYRHVLGSRNDLLAAARQALTHTSELEDAWDRGVIEETDRTQEDTRSNRNIDVRTVLEHAVARAERGVP